MQLPSGQRGFSIGKLFIYITMAIFAGMVFFKLFPIYMDNYSIAASLQKTVEEAERSGGMSPIEIRDAIIRRLGINNIKKIQKGDILISRDSYSYQIAIDYEERVHFIHNVDLVVTFENHAEVKAN